MYLKPYIPFPLTIKDFIEYLKMFIILFNYRNLRFLPVTLSLILSEAINNICIKNYSSSSLQKRNSNTFHLFFYYNYYQYRNTKVNLRSWDNSNEIVLKKENNIITSISYSQSLNRNAFFYYILTCSIMKEENVLDFETNSKLLRLNFKKTYENLFSKKFDLDKEWFKKKFNQKFDFDNSNRSITYWQNVKIDLKSASEYSANNGHLKTNDYLNILVKKVEKKILMLNI